MEAQLAIIGAGPGGYVAAIRAAQRGAKAVLIERDQVGGVCLNRGCIPTKALVASAQLLTRIKKAGDYGLTVGEARPDLARIVQRKDEVVRRLVGGVGFLLKKYGVQLVKGTARFVSPRELSVDTAEGTISVTAEAIIVAAGTKPLVPQVFGHDGRLVMTSDEVLNLTELPARLVVIGGGVIGCEFASIYRALGTEVSVVEMLPRLLPMLDAELGKALELSFKKRGIAVRTGAKVEEVSKESATAGVRLSSGEVLTTERVLVAIGRQTVANELDLEAAGLAVDHRGRIAVGRDLRTTVPGIFAIGDINDLPYDLAHAASHQGLAVVETLYGPGRVYMDEAVPSCVFTDPEIASVGLTVEEAESKGLLTKTGKFPYAASGKAMAMGEPEGWVKMVAEAGSGRLLGVHIMGAHAADLIGEAALAVHRGVTAHELTETIHAHPTLAETLMEAAEGVLGAGIHV